MPDFAKELAIAVAEVEAKTDKQYRAAVVDLFNRVVIKTPRDTGAAAASWLVGPNNTGAIGNVEVSFTISDIRPIGAVSVLYSNIPYMKRLSEGWSEQRANGWIQAEVLTWPQTVKKYEGF